jgi:hypothetical protein
MLNAGRHAGENEAVGKENEEKQQSGATVIAPDKERIKASFCV